MIRKIGLLLFVGCASFKPMPPVSVVVVGHDDRVKFDARLLQRVIEDAVAAKVHDGRPVTVSVALDSKDVNETNEYLVGVLTRRVPLFGKATDFSNVPVTTGRTFLGMSGTIVLGSYTITDSAGHILKSEPLNLGFLDYQNRKLTVLHRAGTYLAERVADLR